LAFRRSAGAGGTTRLRSLPVSFSPAAAGVAAHRPHQATGAFEGGVSYSRSDRHRAVARIGVKAGPLSQWLFSAPAEADSPVICVETRHMRAVLKAQINKTDRNDARGIAQMMRVGLYRAVHVKTLRSQKLRMLLTHRKLLQSKAIAVDNDLRGTL